MSLSSSKMKSIFSSVGLGKSKHTITLCCWVLRESKDSFEVDIDDSKSVSCLKEAIVKKKPYTFANIEADKLTLWQVSSFLHFHIFVYYTHGFLARCLSGAPSSSPTISANNTSLKKILYWDQIACRAFSPHPDLLKGSST